MPTIPELPAASATTDESELAVIYKNGTTCKAVLADILALRQQANAILTSLSGLGAGVGFLQKTGPTSFVTTYIPGAGAYDPLGTAQAINDAHNLDAGAHAAAGFAKLGAIQTFTAAQTFSAPVALTNAIAGSSGNAFSVLGTQAEAIHLQIKNASAAGGIDWLLRNAADDALQTAIYGSTYAGNFGGGSIPMAGAAFLGAWGSGISSVVLGTIGVDPPVVFMGNNVETARFTSAGWKFAAGLAAAPSVAIGESGTGLFQVSAGVLGISLSGVARVQVTGSSVTHNQNDAALGVGGVVGVGSGYEVFSPDSGNALNTLTTFGGSAQLIMRKANGTGAAPAASSAGSVFGQVGFRGYGASGWATGNRAYLVATATENWTDSAQGCRMSIYSTPTGSNTASETFRFDAGGSTLYTALNVRAANALRVETAAGQDAVAIVGRAGGSGNYAVTITPPTLSAGATVTLPSTTCTLAGLGIAQTWTAAQTFRGASAIRVEQAATQDAVVLAGRAGGTSSYAVTFTPTTLTASRTVTIPNEAFTIPSPAGNITWTGIHTFRGSEQLKLENAANQDSISFLPRNGGTSGYSIQISTQALTGTPSVLFPDAYGVIMLQTSVPSTAGGIGKLGQFAYDTNYFYVCTAVNTWKRVALATW